MKAFRNTGIEGGYGSLATQNYLLNLRKSDVRMGRITGNKPSFHHSLGKKEQPTKIIDNPFPKHCHKLRAIACLLQYGNETEPAILGTAYVRDNLVKAGLLIAMGPRQFQITQAGHDYIAQLKSKVKS